MPDAGSLGSARFIEGDSEWGRKHTGNIAERHDTMEKVLCQGCRAVPWREVPGAPMTVVP